MINNFVYDMVTERNFNEDFANSNSLVSEWIKVLKKIFGEECEIIFKNDRNVQLGFGTDVTIQQKNGRRFSVELKTKRYELKPFETWVLELKHHRYSDVERENLINSKEGWLYNTTAEYIINGTLSEDKTKIIEVLGHSLHPFKDEIFKKEISKLPVKFAYTYFNDSGIYQTTVFALASKDFLLKNAIKSWYFEL